jgi:DNA-directed RNA polymerase specialized sigma24 family protein
MATDDEGSVTQWIGPLKRGEQAAVQPLWERYFDRLSRLARARLIGNRGQAADEEDVALSAIDSFCRAAAADRFASLHDRNDLWRLLVALTARKAVNLRRHSARLKRGGGRLLDEAALADPDSHDAEGSLDALAGEEPTPEFAAMIVEDFHRRLEALGDASLRQVAVWKMDGLTTEEIAERINCTPRTVANKLKLIRLRWEGDR